jgi:diguanylate cyclase (GGDEF)-like protein/PAS domain S-box-containing protein
VPILAIRNRRVCQFPSEGYLTQTDKAAAETERPEERQDASVLRFLPVLVSLAYVAISAVWLASSATLLSRYLFSGLSVQEFWLYQGWAFTVAMTALLYVSLSVAVRRASRTRVGAPRPSAVVRWRLPAAVLLLFGVAVAATGYVTFNAYESLVLEAAKREVTSIARAKRRSVERYLTERIADTRQAAESGALYGRAQRLDRGMGNVDRLRADLFDRIEAVRTIGGYEFAAIRDRSGAPLISVGHIRFGGSCPAWDRSTQIGDFTLAGGDSGAVALAIATPLYSAERDPQATEAEHQLCLAINVTDNLFRNIRLWPLPSRTAESYITWRTGDEVLLWGLLKHDNELTSSVRLSRADAGIIDRLLDDALSDGAVMVGLDRDGERVLAAVQPVTGTHWRVVSKIDETEVLTPVRDLAAWTSGLVAMLIALAGAAFTLWIRSEYTRLMLREAEAHAARRRVQARLDGVTRQANDAIILYDENLAILDANVRAEEFYRYSREELVGMDVGRLRAPESRDNLAETLEQLATQDGLVFETVHQRKDGSVFPVEISLRALQIDGRLLRQGIVRDITERRRQEEFRQVASRALESSDEALVVSDARHRVVSVNPAFTRITGYSLAEVAGGPSKVLRSNRHAPEFYDDIIKQVDDNGSWQGERWGRRKSGDDFPMWMTVSVVRDDAGRVKQYVTLFSDISELKQNEEKLKYLAYHDSLTGLPNRAYFEERGEEILRRTARHGGQGALVYCDIDNFKNINDTLGLRLGDEVIREVGERLKSLLREDDVLARPGGDEFLVLLGEVRDVQDVMLVLEKIGTALAPPMQVNGHELFISLTMGVATFPKDGETVDELLRNADSAAYEAKASGRSGHRFFSAELQARARERFEMGNLLRHAVERGEFRLDYQPRVSLGSGDITGVEALVRWQHPELGLVSPARFIPVAEATGAINGIGMWVLRTACATMADWRRRQLPIPRIAVNVSAIQLADPGFVAEVSDIVAASGIPGSALELEITESVAMANPESVIPVLDKLRKQGILIAIDDFGTGYSSLSYLKRLPVSYLKIDKSFVDGLPLNLEDVNIVQAIIALAKSLELRLIAEGVEREEQREFLAAAGCEEMQGYLYSRPLSGADLLARYGTPATNAPD